MMHQVTGRKLGVKSPHRKAMLANLCSSLILHQRIETTLTRAKELRRVAERMITLGKKNTIHARRRALQVLRNPKAVKIVFDELAPQFTNRLGGYTRILKLGFRRGDAAPMALIEYLTAKIATAEKGGDKPAKTVKPKKSRTAGKKAAAEAAPEAVEKEASGEAKPKKKASPKKTAVKKDTKKSEE